MLHRVMPGIGRQSQQLDFIAFIAAFGLDAFNAQSSRRLGDPCQLYRPHLSGRKAECRANGQGKRHA
ncbi:hypothetical protein RN01_05430 [Cupriavidus sp. SHE]|nr:hypothetical protein RN01_05430 [Cupriavidus sp. SHE]